eukprot:m.219503 g.219503  ORF g.219503 m.219503 type:complete len:70 (-) comp33293_c4_seq9:124-333(-)
MCKINIKLEYHAVAAVIQKTMTSPTKTHKTLTVVGLDKFRWTNQSILSWTVTPLIRPTNTRHTTFKAEF